MAKSHYCLLEKFNNYFNRKVIKFDTLNEYIADAKDYHIPENSDGTTTSFDFIPNDNVTTEIIVNDVPFTPDYFLELDLELNIKSRWFVMETVRNRQGQWVYQLKRDVIADNLNSLIKAPIFVHKGMLHDNDPMVLNDEGMSFNQIKTMESFIKDKSMASWIVCYLAKSLTSADVDVDLATESAITDFKTLGELATELGVNESALTDLVSFDADTPKSIRLCTSTELYFAYKAQSQNYFNIIGMATSPDFTSTSGGQTTTAQSTDMTPLYQSGIPQSVLLPFATTLQNNASAIVNQIDDVLDRTYYLQYGLALPVLQRYNGLYIKYVNKFYKLRLVINGDTITSKRIVNSNYSSWETVSRTANPDIYQSSGTIDIYFREKDISIYLDEVSREESDIPTIKAKISSARKTCNNQEFDMIAIPASTIYYSNNGLDKLQTGDLAQRLASALAIKEDANIYDVQLLPFCPIPSIISDENVIDITNLQENVDFNYIKKSGGEGIFETSVNQDSDYVNVSNHITYRETVGGLNGIPSGSTFTFSGITSDSDSGGTISNIQITQDGDDVVFEFDVTPEVLTGNFYVGVEINWTSASDIDIGVVLYVEEASFSSLINMPLTLKDSMKIDSNCDFYRLVSPNYQGSFDFNVARNGGSVEFFTAYCTYKPYTPFIKVAPNLNYLYGSDYNDNRGLICGGDFSLPRASSAWQSYQLQNKNYQNIFNREIQNLDFMQSIERRNQIVSGAVGIFTDTAKGIAGGAIASGGNPIGAIVGGAVSMVGSTVGYGVDVDTLARTQRETKQLAIDKFNYQLGNIKALPYTLTKVGAFDISSKIFPILEYYTCTEQEKQALRDKIKWESMTVMRIGTLEEFMNFDGELHYFKGELIRNDEIADDTHIMNAIYEELLKGVYI